MALPVITRGVCETCAVTDEQVLTKNHGDMMCASCIALENAAQARTDDAKRMLAETRKIDAAIEVKMDVFTATTMAAKEVKAAIDNNDEIPADRKDYAMAEESLRRFKHLQEVILGQRQELIAKENELRAWQTQVQEFAGKLHTAEKEKYKNFDVSYVPAKPVKPVKVSSTPSKKFVKAELGPACTKYNVPAHGVQMMAVQRNMTAMDAAKELRAIMDGGKK